ncbi:unnamed protein product [Closterium sp. NIES-53]
MIGDDEESEYEEFAFAFFSPVEMLGELATLKEALKSSDAEEWKKAMESELKSIEENSTWELVELPEGRKAITSKWLFKIKSNAGGKIERYKSRLVAKGYQQKEKVEYKELFALVVKPTTLRTLLAGAAIKGWVVKQMGVTTAFLNDILEEEIFMAQLEGFDDGSGRVWKLKKVLYGLKQAPRQWYLKLRDVLEEIGFTLSSADRSLFMLGEGEQRSFMVSYVDDILIFSPSSDLVKEVMLKLQDKFKRKALGDCVKGPEEESAGEEERRRFHSMVGSLMYAAVNTRPDVAFATRQSLPPLPPLPAPPCLPCIEGRQRAAPHSSSFPPTTAPLQTLHMDVWGPARVSGQGPECYFLLVVDEYTRYTTVFPVRSKGEVLDVLIPWIRAVRLQLRERFHQDLPILRLHPERGGEFSSDLFRDIFRGVGILQSFVLPASPQQNGIAEYRIGLVMEDPAPLGVFQVDPLPGTVPVEVAEVLGLPSSTGLSPPLLCPPPDQSQPPLQPAFPLIAPSPYTEQTGGLTERREPVSRPASPVRDVHTGRHRAPLLSPLASSLADRLDPESDLARAAGPTVPRLLANVVTDPSFESAAASALVNELVDFAVVCRLDYATALVAEFESACPPFVKGECSLGTDVLEDLQEDFECLAAAVPSLVAMM